MAETILSEFSIGIMINDSSSTDALYANGNQQCKVFIRVLKESRDDDGSWRVEPLSEAEKASLTVLPYSNELQPAQATGWSCDDKASDEFDEGLWRGTASVGLRGSPATTSVGATTAPEEFYRYMSFDGKLAPVQPTTFMAYIKLDNGKQYTTHFDDGAKDFESSITIAPQRPYVLHVNDLMFYRSNAYSDGGITVNTYYWALPGGLRILRERFDGAGWSNAKLAYAYGMRKDGDLRFGMAIRVGVTSLTLNEIDGTVSSSAQVPLINSDCILRGARYANSNSPNGANYNNLMYWTITDNYGCESRFVLKANRLDTGNTLELLNG